MSFLSLIGEIVYGPAAVLLMVVGLKALGIAWSFYFPSHTDVCRGRSELMYCD